MANQTELEELAPARGALAMEEQAAEGVAWRVKLHLYRGSIEKARESLEAGWREHLEENAALPTGPALLEEPLSRVVDDVRALNMLEEEGILTIGQLLKTTPGELMAIPNMGHITSTKILNICRGLAERAALPLAAQVPTS
jgi:DNA-directed RNA polymerase alpha subunit